MEQGLAFLDRFTIRQLIFVNSAAYAFTEIRVDQHTVLFGRNNLGKTSMLNALKLFLLPEVNFYKCKAKFAFKSSKGELYEGTQSYQYYFPEDRAFIILEAENVHGDFCLVLHRGSTELSYSRMAVPVPWHRLRHLFWSFDAEINEGLGGPLETLSLKGLLAELGEYGAEPLGDVRLIRERLFSENPLDAERGRYGLLPFRQGGKPREIDAWRQLIHLAFDISARDERTLPNTIATIIEGEKQRTEEEVAVDLAGVLDEYHQLSETAKHIQKVHNLEPEWQAFDRQWQHYQRNALQQAQRFRDSRAALERELQHGETMLKVALLEHEQATEAFDKNAEAFRVQSKQLDELNGELRANRTVLQDRQKKLHTIARIRGRFDETLSVEQLIAVLRDQLAELESRQTHLNDQAKRRDRMETLISDQKRLQRDITRLQRLLDEDRPALLDAVSNRSATVLLNVNPAFASIVSQPAPSQLQTIEAFTELFTQQNERLDFLGEPLLQQPPQTYNSMQQRETWQSEIGQYRQKMDDTERELQALNELGRKNSAELRQQLAQLKADISEVKGSVNLVSSYQMMDEEAHGYEQKVAEQEKARKVLQEQVEGLKQKSDLLHKAANEKQQKEKLAKEQLELYRRLNTDLNEKVAQMAPVIKSLSAQMQAATCEVSEEIIKQLIGCAADLKGQGESLKVSLSRMLRENLLETDADEGFKSDYSLAELKQYHQQFRQLFDNLPAQEQNYRDNVRAHNKQTAIKIDELRTTATQIRLFETELNRQFCDYRVSNLAEIRVRFELHPRFEALLQEMETVNFYENDRLYDARLYNRLNDFCEQFFSRENGRVPTLRMEQIIRKVGYRYRLEGKEQFEDKEQSNGTSSMVNCLLLSILLKRLLRKDARISVPLVMDEMGSLDRENLETAVSIADDHGFALFGANPDISSEIVSTVRNYVSLGAFAATTSYSTERTVVYHSQCEQLAPIATAAAAAAV